jgi:hypothetical protein
MNHSRNIFEGTAYYPIWSWLEQLYDILAGDDVEDEFDNLFILHDGKTLGADADRHRLWWLAMSTLARMCAISCGHDLSHYSAGRFAALARLGVGVDTDAVAQLDGLDALFVHVFATQKPLPAEVATYLNRREIAVGVMVMDDSFIDYRTAMTSITIAGRVACLSHRQLAEEDPLTLSSRVALMLLGSFETGT